MNKQGKKSIIRETPQTYDDYAKLDDGNRYELASGRLELMSPAPSVHHQMVSAQIQKRLMQSCEDEYLILDAPVDVILDKYEVRQPDLVIIHRSRMHIVSRRGVIGAPDLVVEILSPSTLRRDKIDKIKVYALYGIPEYWLVDPFIGALEQYILNDKVYELAEIYTEDEHVSSSLVSCASFTMRDIMNQIPDLQ